MTAVDDNDAEDEDGKVQSKWVHQSKITGHNLSIWAQIKNN